MVDHEHQPTLLGCLNELHRLVARGRDGLGDQHVFAGFERAQGELEVRRDGSGDDHGVD